MKKLFTLFFALVASIGTMFAAITVRLDPQSCSSWSTVRLWAWTSAGNVFDAWPGEIVSTDDDGWYSYTFDNSITSVSIIWNNGTAQTVDITNITESTCFALKSTTGTKIAVNVVDCPISVYPDPEGQKYKIGDLYYHLDFNNKTAEVTMETSWENTSVMSNYKGLATANIPSSVTYNNQNYIVTSIGDFAFARDAELTSITIPNSVTSIGINAFYCCSGLSTITIPENVTYIGYAAFEGCQLSYITLEPTTPPEVGIGGDGYRFISNVDLTYGIPAVIGFSINVPCGTLETYHQAEGWLYWESCNAHYCLPSLRYAPTPYTITTIAKNGYVNYGDSVGYWVGNYVENGDFKNRYEWRRTVPTACDDSVTFRATPNEYYHFVRWSDGSTENPHTVPLTSDITLEAIFAPNPVITYEYDYHMGGVYGQTTTSTGIGADSITFTAYPHTGLYFARWADGNTDNPRTIWLSQDTTMMAIFDYYTKGKCGKDSALTWTFDKDTKALEITGQGELTDNYTYSSSIEYLTIGNKVTIIGKYAFDDCKLKNIILGSSVRVIESRAFDIYEECTYDEYSGTEKCQWLLSSITCYSQRPPTVKENAFSYNDLPYSTIIYVPADYVATYKAHDFWGMFDVRPLGATSSETNVVSVTPSATTADVVWPSVSGAATYELVIKDANGNAICTLTFNAQGQLISIAFNAPSRNNAPQQAQAAGFSFTVTSLDSGTTYSYTMTAKDNNGNVLKTESGTFTTTGESQGFENVQGNNVQCTKVVRDGQIFILRGNKTYTLQGQEVK